MSQKNHIKVEGRLLQINKKYADLELKQKERILEWMFQETKVYYEENHAFPDDPHVEDIVDRVYDKIEQAGIWIPYEEVRKHYRKKRADIHKRIRRMRASGSENVIEKTCFMNMCMIQDEQGNVLALDKVDDDYTGTTFPGGHVEREEAFYDSIVREIREETGLEIKDPSLWGVYHWKEDGIHNVIFLYKANEFSGVLKSSEEGRVYWISLEEMKKKDLAVGMENVLKIMDSRKYSECRVCLGPEGYKGTLY